MHHAPVASSERIDVLDVLRGLALVGMLLVHFNDQAAPGAGWTAAVQAAIGLLVSERFFALFAFLFGVGFAIQLERAERAGVPFVRLYVRRLAGLFLFGLAADLLLGYSVLLGYSLFAIPLLLVRRWSSRRLVVVALALTLGWAGLRFGIAAWEWARYGAEAAAQMNTARWAPFRESWEAVTAARSQPSYLVLVAARLRHMAVFYTQPFMLVPNELALFLIGLLAVRAGLFHEPRRRTRLIVAAMAVGVAAWACAAFLLPRIPPVAPDAVLNPLRHSTRLGQWLMFTYAGTVILLWTYVPRAREVLRPLSWAGRMALTNYFVQILVLDLLRSDYGLGIGPLEPALVVPATAVFFAAQVAGSRWWLADYRFGPLEWLWRTWTYRARQPIRRAPAAPAVGAEPA